MSESRIVKLGHPVLRTPAEPVPREAMGSAELRELAETLEGALRASGGLGLAAPQIGVNWQMMAFQYDIGGGQQPVKIVVNPMLKPHSGNPVYDWEGCVSVPDLLGLVPRQIAVQLLGHDVESEPMDLEVTGVTARVVQHEFDHLHGITFLDRMRDMRSLTYLKEWEEFVAGGEQMAVG